MQTSESNTQPATPSPRLWRMPDIKSATRICKSKIYSMIADGSFPPPVKIGRATAFVRGEVEAWIQARIAESRQPAAS